MCRGPADGIRNPAAAQSGNTSHLLSSCRIQPPAASRTALRNAFLLASHDDSLNDCASSGRYRGRMPPGAKRYARNNTSTSAPPMSSTLFLSIASSPFLAASLHDLTSPVHYPSALRPALRCSVVRAPQARQRCSMTKPSRAKRVAVLNDRFRKSLVTGSVGFTRKWVTGAMDERSSTS